MLKKLVAYVRTEPVRVHLYLVASGVLAFLVSKNYVHTADLPYILGVVAAILGVENLRSLVTPDTKVQPEVPPAPAEVPPAQ